MNGQGIARALIAGLVLVGTMAQARIFTSTDGKEIDAILVATSRTHAMLKLKKTGRTYKRQPYPGDEPLPKNMWHKWFGSYAHTKARWHKAK